MKKQNSEAPEDNYETVAATGRNYALSGNVYQQIRAAISSGELQPGHRVTETQLAASLNVSRTPIREAIQRLQADGLMQHTPRLGLIVRQLEYQEIVELYAMRQVLESTAAAFAAQLATEPEFDILSDIVDMEAAVDPENAELSVNYNRLFHETLAQSGHNQYLIESLNTLENSMILLGESTLATENRLKQAIEEHRAIVDAMRARDSDAARDAMTKHIKEAQRRRLQMFMQSQTR